MTNPTTENKLGSNCTGTDGESNRVLTLANTEQTIQAGFMVYVSGLAISINQDYLVTHKVSGTTITFLNPLYDATAIIITYYVVNQVSYDTYLYNTARADFQNILNEHGIIGTLTRTVDAHDTMGGMTSQTTSSYNIIFMMQNITMKDREIIEMGLAVSGNTKAYFYYSYPDSITGNGTLAIQVGDVIATADTKKWKVEQILNLRVVQGYEAFRTGILKRIDLDVL